MEFVRAKRPTLSLDLAPLVDIIFQLLIFFMLSSSFLHPALQLNLPKASSEAKPVTEKIVISVNAEEKIYVNTQEVKVEDLKMHLQQVLEETKGKMPPVHIRGDAEMPYGIFVNIMDQARQAGASQIQIVHLSE